MTTTPHTTTAGDVDKTIKNHLAWKNITNKELGVRLKLWLCTDLRLEEDAKAYIRKRLSVIG